MLYETGIPLVERLKYYDGFPSPYPDELRNDYRNQMLSQECMNAMDRGDKIQGYTEDAVREYGWEEWKDIGPRHEQSILVEGSAKYRQRLRVTKDNVWRDIIQERKLLQERDDQKSQKKKTSKQKIAGENKVYISCVAVVGFSNDPVHGRQVKAKVCTCENKSFSIIPFLR
jgi:hypothetical protein